MIAQFRWNTKYIKYINKSTENTVSPQAKHHDSEKCKINK